MRLAERFQCLLFLILVGNSKKDKTYRRYAAGIERALATFDSAQQEWADYIAFLARLLKVRFTNSHDWSNIKRTETGNPGSSPQLRYPPGRTHSCA